MSLVPARRILCLAMLAWSASAVVGQTTQPKLEVKRDGVSLLLPGVTNPVVAWGDNFSGQTTVPSGLSNVIAIAAGYEQTLALKQDGTVVAWGANSTDQTTVPSGLSSVTAVAVGGGTPWR